MCEAEETGIRRYDATSTGGRLPFGNLLRELRIAAGLSQEALAERARISLDTIGALERGRRQVPHRDTLALISEGLGLSADARARLEAAAVASRTLGRPRLNLIGHDVGAADDGLPPHNLPYAVNSFRGRERQVHEIAAFIATRRLVTLHGTGGVGKTRLALEVAHAHLENKDGDCRDGAWFVDLAAVSDADGVAAGIAHTLGIREVPNEPVLDTLVATLRVQRCLIVLDGCEHVLERVAQVAERLVQACPSVRVLTTSSEALEVEGELVYDVEALALPGWPSDALPRSLDKLRASPAVQLFLDRASDADPHFFLADAERDPEAVAEICERLDGLPLTLELAAARVRDMTLRDICTALDSRFALLARGKRTAPPRHRTLRALLEWSYALLGQTEQRVFRQLGAFTGTWTVDAAVAVCGEAPEVVREAVGTLVSKSLVTVVHEAQDFRRFRLLESLRAFARALLDEHGEVNDAARRHAEYYRERAHAAAERWESEPSRDPFTVFGALIDDLADVRTALDWAVTQRHDIVLGAELTSVLADVWAECGLDVEGLRRLDAASSALGGQQRNIPPAPSLRLQEAAGGTSEPADDTADSSTPHWLASFNEERSYDPADVIFRAGETAGELLYIASGAVRLEEIGVEVGPGEILGEIAFFSAKNRRTASAVCLTAVVVRAIPRHALLDLYDRDPAFRLYLIGVFTRRLLADLEGVRERQAGGPASDPA